MDKKKKDLIKPQWHRVLNISTGVFLCQRAAACLSLIDAKFTLELEFKTGITIIANKLIICRRREVPSAFVILCLSGKLAVPKLKKVEPGEFPCENWRGI